MGITINILIAVFFVIDLQRLKIYVADIFGLVGRVGIDDFLLAMTVVGGYRQTIGQLHAGKLLQAITLNSQKDGGATAINQKSVKTVQPFVIAQVGLVVRIFNHHQPVVAFVVDEQPSHLIGTPCRHCRYISHIVQSVVVKVRQFGIHSQDIIFVQFIVVSRYPTSILTGKEIDNDK